MSFDCPDDHALFLEISLVNEGFTHDEGQQGEPSLDIGSRKVSSS
jgi:hypothetical protein